MAYFAMVRSIVEYASCIWDPHLKQDINSVEKVQRNGARFVKGEYRRGPEISVSDMVLLLKWESLQTRRQNSRLYVLQGSEWVGGSTS